MDRQLHHIAIMLLLAVSTGSVSGQEMTEQAVFCRTYGRIEDDSSAMRPTAEWRNRIVADFLKYADCPYDIVRVDYCDSYCSLLIDDSTRISVDCVTFQDSDNTLAKWLNDIPDSTYTEIDIPAEAPEKCIAFRKGTTLVIVWCNLFADSEKIWQLIELYKYYRQKDL